MPLIPVTIGGSNGLQEDLKACVSEAGMKAKDK